MAEIKWVKEGSGTTISYRAYIGDVLVGRCAKWLDHTRPDYKDKSYVTQISVNSPNVCHFINLTMTDTLKDGQKELESAIKYIAGYGKDLE